MTVSANDKRRAFRALHQEGCFVLPNPWDLGSARLLQHLGFAALASTSAGYAWTTGRPDYAVTLSDVLEHLRTLSASVELPINADFESGFGRTSAELGENVQAALAAGVAGLSIEDRKVGEPSKLYELPEAVERIRAARAAIDARDGDAILVARTELLLLDATRTSEAIDRLVALADAGADCLYAPGVLDKQHIAAMVKAVAPKPVNVLVLDPTWTVAELADLGVRRISIGGRLAAVAYASARAAAEAMLSGSFAGLAPGWATPGMNATMAALYKRD